MRNEWKNTTLESALGWQSQDNQAVSARDSAYWPSLIVLHNDGSDYEDALVLFAHAIKLEYQLEAVQNDRLFDR